MISIADVANVHDFRGLEKDLEDLKKVVDKQKLGNGSTFLNIENGDVYFYDKENDEWHKI